MDNPPCVTIEANRQLYRVVKREFDSEGKRLYVALDPNPYANLTWFEGSDVRATYSDGQSVPGRFSPFRSNGSSVPTLYLAATKETAYFEAMLRPIGSDAIHTLEAATLEPLEAASLSFESDLILADCRRTYLHGGADEFWQVTYEELFESSQMKSMDNARTLAKYIYDTYPDIDGLVWDSVQHGRIVPVYMLFGQRRAGSISHTIMALDDVATWKPYLRDAIEQGQLIAAPSLTAYL